jgi:outer membrane receptor protein involved in Fe transport
MDSTVVIGHLDEAREQIVPNLGATAYTFGREQIETLSQGANAPFSQVILRAPGVTQDSAANGDLHVRGEHANLQYRINDVLLPEGISGFGLELDPRFVDQMQLITGTLPAQYGFRTAGVVDIHTKSGAFENGGGAELYGGSYDTIHPTFELGGSQGKWNYYVDGGYNRNELGIENPTSSTSALHDLTEQYKAFTYMSYVIDDTSRVSILGSASYSDFQVPNTTGLPPGAQGAIPWYTYLPVTNFDSSVLNENQNEQNYYGVVAYQKSADKLNFQAAAFGRISTVHFRPDPVGDLFFNGVASDVDKGLYSAGVEFDGSYELTDSHTIRSGLMFVNEYVSAASTTTVFNVDGAGNPLGAAYPIAENQVLHGIFAGLYLQDEWKIAPKLTANFGGRFDVFSSSFDRESQLSPRVNLIYQPTEATSLHAGYARYFTPPPVESVSAGTVARFDGTSNASATDLDTPVKAERANYYGAGITQRIAPGLQFGVDGYYKTARNQLDDGLFGQTLILSAFNYRRGDIHGVEFTLSYAKSGFSSYANLALSKASGQEWISSQFLLDHDQTISGSFGVSYRWEQSHGGTRVFADAIYGSGLRTDATAPDGSNIPNGGSLLGYYSINLGAEQSFKVTKHQVIRARLDVVNVTDHVYELRDGAGVGVNAAQYGMRRGFFGSLSASF